MRNASLLSALILFVAGTASAASYSSFFGFHLGESEDELTQELKNRGVKDFVVLTGEGAQIRVPKSIFCTVNMAPEGVSPKIAPLRKYLCPMAWSGSKQLMIAVFHIYKKAVVELEFVYTSSGGSSGLKDMLKTFGPKYDKDPIYARKDLLVHNRPDSTTVCTATPCHTLGWIDYKTRVTAGVLYTGEPTDGQALVLRIVDTIKYQKLTTDLQNILLKNAGH